ncbi:SIS domain-containing protein [Candidatus Gracilibacteria bacterium]|nr:SIS domain-containing protein [Candidatus Gracilibacteria bacterium]
MQNTLKQYWAELALIAQAIDLDEIAAAAAMLLNCHRRGGTIFIFGNGGSAATAAHFACDLAKGTRSVACGGLRVLALVDSAPLLTAWANDSSYERIFAEQVTLLARPGDLVLAISASGNSPNVLAGVQAARTRGAETIALTGWPGGALRTLVDLAVHTPDACIELVEDMHMAMAHSICVVLREQLASVPNAELLALAVGQTS